MKNFTKSIQTYLFALILFLFVGSVNAQKFGDIDIDRLQEESHPSDADASHAYIFKNCYVHYDLGRSVSQIVSEYHYRIKIYNDDGVNQANIVKYIYRNKRDREGVYDVKAECHNFVNGKVEKIKLDKKAIFKEEVDENTTKVSFAIPKARAGSVIDFKYKVRSPFLYSFPRHYFQEEVPVDYSELKVDVPDYFTMAPSATGLIALNRTEEKTTAYGASVTQFTFAAEDIPGIAKDKYVLDINDYRSSLKYELSAVNFPGRERQVFTEDWNSICENLKEAKLFGGTIDRKVKQAKDLLTEIETLRQKEKLERIVDFINTNITWNGKVGKYGSSNYKKLFEAKTGDVADINLLLINLCRKAGLNANPVLTKYRFHGLLNTAFPSLTELNYVFAVVDVEDTQLFVDASSSYFEPGTLPLRALNLEGILIKDDINQIISLTNNNLNYNRFAGKYNFNLDKKRLEGVGKYIMKNYAAAKARKKKLEENDEEDLQDLVKENVDEEVDEGEENDEDSEDDDDELEEQREDVYRYSDIKGYDKKYGNISSSFEAELYSPLAGIGNELYVDAFVTLAFDGNPFLNEMRKYPAFFNSKHHINHVAILTVPEGYKIKSKPDNIALKMINDKGLFTYAINEGAGKITVNTVFKINDDIFQPDEYASLYEFFNEIIIKQKEKIVFIRE